MEGKHTNNSLFTWRIPRTVWVLTSVAIIVGYVTFMYADLLTTYDNSIILLSGSYHGLSPLDFYDYSIEMCRTPYAANYNFFIYLIWATWNAPAFLVCKLVGMDYLYSTFGHLWAKTLLVVGILVACYFICRILRCCGVSVERRNLAIFVMLSSPLVYSTVLIETGIDIICIDFMLWGIAMLLEGSQLGFLISFAMATPCKMFPLFLSLPLLLLVDKNVLRAFAKWVSTAILLVVEKCLFSRSPAYDFALFSQSRDAIGQLFTTSFLRFSVFLTVFLAVIIYCYLYEGMEGSSSLLSHGQKTDVAVLPREARTLLYVCALIFGTFVAFVPGNNYWSVLYVPFFAIMCALSRDRLAPVLVALETVGSLAHFLSVTIVGSITVNEGREIVSRLLLPLVIDIPSGEVARYATPQQLLEQSPLASFNQAFLPLFAGCVFLTVILSNPSIQDHFKDDAPAEKSLQHVLPWVRALTLIASAAFVIYAYTATINQMAMTTFGSEAAPLSQSLVEGDGHELRQTLSFDRSTALERLVLRFDNPSPLRCAFGSVTVRLADVATNEILWEDTLGVSTVEDDSDVWLTLPKVKVEEGHAYELRLVGKGDTLVAADRFPIYPYVTNEHAGGDLVGTLTLDGVAQEGSLLFSLR